MQHRTGEADADGRRSLEVTPIELMELLRSVFDSCANAVFVVDGRGRVAWANAAFQAIAGHGPVVGPDSLLKRLSTSDRHALWAALAEDEANPTVGLRIEGMCHHQVEVHFTRLVPSAIVGVVAEPVAAPQGTGVFEQTLKHIAGSLAAVGIGVRADDPRSPLPDDLTGRQREVVEMLFRSMSEKEVAGALFLSVHTVRNHKKAAFRTLGVHSKAELFSTYKSGLFEPSLGDEQVIAP